MKNKPLVSILMTSYNREKYIKQAIKSVLQQTYKNFELIIVDDCSNDNTLKQARELACINKKIKIYKNKCNVGDYSNRNIAASYAQGKYLKYVDADDYIYPNGICTLVSMMESNPEAGYGLCSLPQIKNKPFPILLNCQKAYEWHFLGPSLFHKAPLSSIIKRCVFEKIGGFLQERMSSDYGMWLRLSQEFPVLLMPEGIVWYREHEEQEMQDYKHYVSQYERLTWNYLYSKKCPLSKKSLKKIIQKEKRRVIKTIFRLFCKGETRQARKIIKYAKINMNDFIHFFF